jgi:hypothetical protein
MKRTVVLSVMNKLSIILIAMFLLAGCNNIIKSYQKDYCGSNRFPQMHGFTGLKSDIDSIMSSHRDAWKSWQNNLDIEETSVSASEKLRSEDFCVNMALDSKIKSREERTWRELFTQFTNESNSIIMAKQAVFEEREQETIKARNQEQKLHREIKKIFTKKGYKDVEWPSKLEDIISEFVQGERNVNEAKNTVFLIGNSYYRISQVLNDVISFSSSRQDGTILFKKKHEESTYIEDMSIRNMPSNYAVFVGITRYTTILGVSKQAFVFEFADG